MNPISNISRSRYQFDPREYSTQSVIISLIPPCAKSILDVGCNNGYVGLNSSLNEAKFYGLDWSDDAIQIARKTYADVIKVDLNSLAALPWGLKFDCIIFGDILEHLINPEEVLKNLTKNYLCEGGVVVISLPNIANYAIRLRLLFGNFDYQDSGILDRTHLHFYTRKTAQELIRKSSLEVLTHRSGASIFGVILKWIPKLSNLFATSHIFICKRSCK